MSASAPADSPLCGAPRQSAGSFRIGDVYVRTYVRFSSLLVSLVSLVSSRSLAGSSSLVDLEIFDQWVRL